MDAQDKIVDYLKKSIHNMGFESSLSWKLNLSVQETSKALKELLKTNQVKKVVVPVDYKGNIHYDLKTEDLEINPESLEGKVLDLDDFHELDSNMYDMKESFVLA